MAGAIASVILKLGSLVIQEGESLGKVYNKVESLRQELRQMHCFLIAVEATETTNANVTTWLADIRGIAQDAESLIDTFILKKERHRRRGFFKRYALIFHDLLALRKFRKEIERIQTNICSTSDRKSTYNITIGGDRGEPSSSTETLQQHRQISPHSDERMPTFGLSKDVELLEEQLTQGELRRNVISIVGMGGLGKTRLANSLYNSKNIRNHFDCLAWVYVSRQCKPQELLREIREQIIKSRGGEMVLASESNVAEQSLLQLLENRKYLIVLDDVWTTNVWTTIEGYFPNSNTGSRIVLTTRRRDVALHAEPTSIPHELKLLEDEDGWELFKSTLYKIEKDCPRELEEIGRSILGKCGGLPLAIKLIGGLLSTKKETHEAWSNVFDSLSWHLNQNPEQYYSILAMSYYDLPSYLKPCFLYFATFPEGFQIRDKRLIRLWIAEGIIQQRAEEELEDIGKDYIEELADRYIIQTRNKDRTLNFHLSTEEEEKQKKITQARTEENLGRRNLECSMHSLVREVSLSIARNVDFLDVYVNRDNDASSFNLNNRLIRRLAVHFDGEDSTTWEGSFPNLHSVSVFDLSEGKTQRGEEIGNFVQRSIDNEGFKLLTVLDLEGTYKPRLSKALGKLIHLRYLGLRRTWLEKLPSTVACLFNLQTLDLKCTEIQVIPSAIGNMKELRHLYLNGGVRSQGWFQPIRNHNYYEHFNRKLRTLCGIFIGPEDCVTDRLMTLTNNTFTKIRKLAIEGDLYSQGHTLGVWIKGLERLENLKLRSTAGDKKPIGISSSSTTTEEQAHALPWLENLRTQSCLTKLHLEGTLKNPRFLHSLNMISILTLVGTRIDIMSIRALGHLPNLRILRLWYNSFVGLLMNSSSGSFPKLQVLEVCWLDKLERWMIEEGAMPNLRELEINKCNKLSELPHGLEYLTNLKELRLPAMSDELKSRVLPYTGEDWYKIKHIPFISPPLFTASDSASTGAAFAFAFACPHFISSDEEE